MNSLVIVIIVIALLFGTTASLLYYNYISFRKAARKIAKQRFEKVQSLVNKLESRQLIASADIYDYAKNIVTRQATFLLLKNWGLTELFPEEFYTIEKAAESNLANWLEFPTELGTCPDEIKYVKKVAISLEGQPDFFNYYVFKFRMNHPHWIATKEWMLGVVGPYFDNSKPYDHPNFTFSRFRNVVDADLAEEEATWVHENISLPFANDTSSQ